MTGDPLTTNEEMPTMQEEVDDNCRRIGQLEAHLLSLSAEVHAMKIIFMDYLEFVKKASSDELATKQDRSPNSSHS